MSRQTIIIGPTPPGSSLLEEIRDAAGLNAEPVILRHYPRREELRNMEGGRNRPSAFLIDYADERQAFRVLRDLGQIHPDVPAVVLNGPRRLSAVGTGKASWRVRVRLRSPQFRRPSTARRSSQCPPRV